jgi:hypothetical protein
MPLLGPPIWTPVELSITFNHFLYNQTGSSPTSTAGDCHRSKSIKKVRHLQTVDSISKASYKLPTQNPIFSHHNKPFHRSLVSVYTFGRTTEGKRWEAAGFIQRILRNSMEAHTLRWHEMQLDFDETGGLTERFLKELWMSGAIRKIRELVPVVK